MLKLLKDKRNEQSPTLIIDPQCIWHMGFYNPHPGVWTTWILSATLRTYLIFRCHFNLKRWLWCVPCASELNWNCMSFYLWDVGDMLRNAKRDTVRYKNALLKHLNHTSSLVRRELTKADPTAWSKCYKRICFNFYLQSDNVWLEECCCWLIFMTSRLHDRN